MPRHSNSHDSQAAVPRGLTARLASLLGGPRQRRLARYALALPAIAACEQAFQSETDSQLTERSRSLRYRAQCGQPLAGLLPEAYALVREAGRRTLGMRHFDVQVLGGIALFHGSVAEMQTGEGKTLTATLPLYLRALTGRGALLATVNDYLAHRDAQWMQPLYELLGLTVGVIEAGLPRGARQAAYACDITYGTAREFGFDFLRDRLQRHRTGSTGGLFADASAAPNRREGKGAGVQRAPYFVLVDEADSILIDEARTPLIISAAAQTRLDWKTACYRWSAEMAGRFIEQTHYHYDDQRRAVLLTPAGQELARRLPTPDDMNAADQIEIFEHLETAIRVSRDFHCDRQYVVRDGEIVIVDEFTGRLGEGRRWPPAIHHAVEAREGLELSADTQPMARVTVQDYFQRFAHLAGMTGTALSAARELKRFYGLKVLPIPTNRPVRRQQRPDRVFADGAARQAAVVETVRQQQESGRPVLIGVRSIDKAERLSEQLTAAGIPHQVLSARNHAAEAEIVAAAGQPGRVTVATNMAGRGTDIQLADDVRAAGGLFVILTELHDSARIDRQLHGRAGRQGDPGTVQHFLALDDEILQAAGAGSDRPHEMSEQGDRPLDGGGQSPPLTGARHRQAQRIIEKRHYRQRVELQFQEARRKQAHLEMGQDPFLDSVG